MVGVAIWVKFVQPGALAALDAVAGHADVVGGGAPGQVDLAARRRGRRQACRARRAGSCRRSRADRGRLVGLDLRGRERHVVDADVVDQAGEELAVDAVAADLQRVGRRRDRARVRRRSRPASRSHTGAASSRRRSRSGTPRCSPGAPRCRTRPRTLPPAISPAVRERAVRRARLEVVVVVALVDHIPPAAD